jgi:hypothetical protein
VGDALAGAGFRRGGDLAAPTYRAGPYRATLDLIFLQRVRAAHHGLFAGATGSDHRPVWCRVELP